MSAGSILENDIAIGDGEQSVEDRLRSRLTYPYASDEPSSPRESAWAARLAWQGGMLIIAFEVAYLLESAPSAGNVALGLHLLNIEIGLVMLLVTWRQWFHRFWKIAAWTLCSSLLIITTVISVLEHRPEPLFVSVLLLLAGAGTLSPWNRDWQATLDIVGIGCMAIASFRLPISLYEWFTVFTSIALAHCSVEMGRRNRNELASGIQKMTEIQVNLRDKVAQLERAEQRARESEKTIAHIIESSPDVITVTRVLEGKFDGRFVAVNRAFMELTGVSRDELLTKSAAELNIWPDHEQFKELLSRLQQNSMLRGMEINLRGADGLVHPHLMSAVVTEFDGQPSIISISRDISAIKQTENALKAAREEALAATRAKSEFLSSMSHEIRTPMNAMLGMAELLWGSTLSEVQRRYVDIMRSNGDALLDLINDILDLAKIESGRLIMEHANFDLDDVVDKVGEMMAIRAHEKGIELVTRIAPNVALGVIGDKLRLRQILVNLLGNAIKFTDKGEVLLSVETVAAKSDGGASGETMLRFSVRDTGIGISRDKLDLIFSSFTQADSSTTRKYGGSGLGLAIVRRLVVLYGGEIAVESEPGKGTCFSFTARLGIGANAPRTHVDLKEVRTLVVDDNATNRLIVKEILSREGAEITEASSGTQALTEMARAREAGRPYQLLLLDCRMPEMDGLELAERIKRLYQNDREGLPVLVMLTSDDLGARLARLRDIGIETYLMKPVRRTELITTIHRALEGGIGPVTAAVAPQTETTDGGLPTMRILLADDSAINRMLIREYFKSTPCELDEAENGQIAIEKFKSEHYDLILMDMRMPVMDGYTATREIRSSEQANNREAIPIIALTASALEEEVKRCLEAGCSLHVSKPVKPATLISAVKAATAQRSTGGRPNGKEHANGNGAKLMVTVDGQLRALIPRFLEVKREDLKNALGALERGDYELVSRVGHELKGEGGAFGFDSVSEMGRELEDAAGNQDGTSARKWAIQLADYFERVEVTFAA